MGFMVQQVGSIPAITHNIKNKGGKKMKDGITLHPEHGLNPSIEVCMICGEEMGIALLGNNIKGQAPHHICTGGVCDDCKKIIDEDRKSTRLNSSHVSISYAVFCLKKKKDR